MGEIRDVPVGFLGLGDVGRPVLRRLKEQGAAIHATSRSPALRYKMARDAIDLCGTPGEINSKIKNGLIVLMLSQQRLIDAFLTGEDGLLANLTPGALIIDLGQTSADTTRMLAAQVGEKGAHWLDAPALGTEQEALEGNLTIRVGGRAEDFARAMPLLEAISQDIRHVGELGAGQEAVATA
ncbi:NAD(P)-binding domain-containing protein [Sneathiella marina]|uniref:NAD(P)-binding domain-containing protein n=1 Tax=Sneathiella marina TaxID=2950108 RepID=A0ABY4W0P2_9PROT|nr:NAD(P)-binding domain-containing protein [Sneathiella marina]USG60777.1 NAD(P)-binding domain-containing protein [Sneathiella marina]